VETLVAVILVAVTLVQLSRFQLTLKKQLLITRLPALTVV
jgi:hypothetical protein